jgi:dihydrodipicolinate synthase/N-acetylneuraminate lyase
MKGYKFLAPRWRMRKQSFCDEGILDKKIKELKSKLKHGVLPAMATPLQKDGYTVNTVVIPELVEFLLDAGVKGLFVGGSTGEGILLSATERMRLHETAVQCVNGRVPVLVHVGANQMETAVSLARHAGIEVGATAIAAVTPYYYSMHEDGLAAYYQAIADAAPQTPLFLYDIPHMAVNGITPSLLGRMSQTLPSLAGMKTSNRDAQMIRRLLDVAPGHLINLVGNEAIAIGTMAMGADGVISGMSTAVPEPFVALTRAVGEGDMDAARRHQRIINQLSAVLPAGARIGALKTILAERGIAMGTAVPPRPTPAGPFWSKMQLILAQE